MAKRELPSRSVKRLSIDSRKGKGRARTRAGGLKLIDDPSDDERKLGHQLKQMGLYAAHTLGDGNCLFRALSDQLHGTPNHHTTVRAAVCDYLNLNEARYKAFVDTDEDHSWEHHLRDMRLNGTYGGHLELSAFAHLHRRPIKVIQPGLVYIIGHEDESPAALARRQLRQSKGKARQSDSDESAKTTADDFSEDSPLYIIYHQWEHYSSVRNIDGPHAGPPRIRERKVLAPDEGNGHYTSERETSVATDEITLLRKSLPDGPSYTTEQLARLIEQHGSWEKALEELLDMPAEPEPDYEGEPKMSHRGARRSELCVPARCTPPSTSLPPSAAEALPTVARMIAPRLSAISAGARLRTKVNGSTTDQSGYRESSPATSSSTTTDSNAAQSSSSSSAPSSASTTSVGIVSALAIAPHLQSAEQARKPNSRSRSPAPAGSPGSEVGRRQRRRGLGDSEWETDGSGLESSPARSTRASGRGGSRVNIEEDDEGDRGTSPTIQHINLVRAELDRANELPTRLRARPGQELPGNVNVNGVVMKRRDRKEERRARKRETLATKAALKAHAVDMSNRQQTLEGPEPAALFKELRV